jgi:hypothetical protein
MAFLGCGETFEAKPNSRQICKHGQKGEKIMSAKQTPMLLGRFVEHQENFNSLPTGDAQWAIQNPKDAAVLCVAAIKSRPKEPAPERTYKVLLPPVQPKSTAATPFRVNDTFLNKGNGRVKISGWGSNFESWFGGKEETGIPMSLQAQLLGRDAYDSDIVADLGGEEAAEIATASFWEKIALQGNGQKGELHVDGRANIGYTKDAKVVLRTVYAGWRGGGWYFYADEFPAPFRWLAGVLVLSPRNS